MATRALAQALDEGYFLPASQPPSDGGPVTTLFVKMREPRRRKVK